MNDDFSTCSLFWRSFSYENVDENENDRFVENS